VRSAVSTLILLGYLVVSTGCGRFFFEPRDTSLDAAAPPDGPPIDADTCNPAAPFGAPDPLTELNDSTVSDGTLRLYPDELRGYFWSYRGNPNAELYYVTRATRSTPFTITPVQGLSTTSQELDPTFTSDGTTFVFRRSGPGNDLYVTTPIAPSTEDSFAAPTAIAAINTASDEAQAFIPLGRNELYFESTRTALGDIYMSTFSGTTFAPPALVPGAIASSSDEGDPVVTPDGLTIYFRSNRAASIAGYNIFVATRAVDTDPFGAPQLVPNINTAADDGPSWISPDGCRLYISCDVAGTNDIYVATRGQ
jgi:Tol biopolymer transport system component